MASTLGETLEKDHQACGSRILSVTLLASEWGSNQGGLSNIDRELAIQLAKHPNISVTFFVPRCSNEDKKRTLCHNINIVEATQEPTCWSDIMDFPPEQLEIDIVIGQGVKLGQPSQMPRKNLKCKWIQLVNTDSGELGMEKSCTSVTLMGEQCHDIEEEVFEKAEFVVGVGSKWNDAFLSCLKWGKGNQTVVDFTSYITEQVPEERKHYSVLIFGCGDAKDCEMKGFDITAKAITALPDKDNHLVSVGASIGKHSEETVNAILGCNIPSNNLKDEQESICLDHYSVADVEPCRYVVKCLLKSSPVSFKEQALTNSTAFSGHTATNIDSVQLSKDLSFFSTDSGSTSSLNSLPASPSSCLVDGDCLAMPKYRDPLSQSSSSLNVLNENNPQSFGEQENSEKSTFSEHLHSPTPCFKSNGLWLKLPAKPCSHFSDRGTLSSYEVSVTGKGNPDSGTKEGDQLEDLCQLQNGIRNKDHGLLGNLNPKLAVQSPRESDGTESCLVTNRVSPKGHSNSVLSTNHPHLSWTLQSEGIKTGTFTNDCRKRNMGSIEDESAACLNPCHDCDETINKLNEQVKVLKGEKQQLQAALGRYLFLEDKERRSEKILLSSMASGSDQSRVFVASASPTLTSMNERLLGGAGPLERPKFILQRKLLEISDSLSADELKRMKFLAKGKVKGFRLAKIREGFELFEELPNYIGQLLEGIQRSDLLQKLGPPLSNNAESGLDHPPGPSLLGIVNRSQEDATLFDTNATDSVPSNDNTLTVLQGRQDKETQTSDETLHSSAVHLDHVSLDRGGRIYGSVSRTDEPSDDHHSLASSGSSDERSSNIPVLSIKGNGDSLTTESTLNAGESFTFPDSSSDILSSNSSFILTIKSSDSLVSSAQTAQTFHASSTSQDSSESSLRLTSVSSHSTAGADINLNDSGINPTSSQGEITKKSQLLNDSEDGDSNARTCAATCKWEDREKQALDLCHGERTTNQSDVRMSTLGVEINSTDGHATTQNVAVNRDWHWLGQSVSGHDGVSSASSTDWERLGARPKWVQAQCPPPEPVPEETVNPAVSDGLTGDFLARHSQDKALHESLYRDDADISLFNDTPLQGASCIDGMINSSESNKAKPYLGACQYTSGTDPYSRLGNPSLHVPSNGFGRIGLLGGNSGVATTPLPRHLGGNYVSFRGNYSSSNGLKIGTSYSLQSNFVNNGSRFTGVEHFSRDSYLPYEQRLGLASLNPGNQPVYSGMTGSGFLNYPSMGAVGYQPGLPVYSTQQSTVFSDSASTSTPRQDMRQTTQNASLTLGNQSNDTSNSAQTTSASAGNTGFVDVGNSGLPAPCSVSTCISSSSVVVSTTTSWPALACAGSSTLTVHNNDNDNNEIDVQGAAGGNAESSLAPYCSDANNDNSGGTILNRDFGTDSVESTDNSLLALEQRVSEACALVERVLREREEREQFGREIERKEQLIREQRERERREREERELQEAERWPQQQEAITARSQWLCEHYQRHCRVRFPCCTQFYPCHRCHNNSRACDNEEAKACHATHLKCSHCQHEQEIDENSGKCAKCEGKMSAYFCSICKHFTSVDKNPYHCEKCGICRIHKDKSFHCEVCNVCLDKRLEGNHKCRPDSGHDECCICLEDAFSGCQILPCSHKVHRECAIAMIQNGIRTCPICRHPLYSPPRG